MKIEYAVVEYYPGDEKYCGGVSVTNDGYTDIKEAEADRIRFLKIRKTNPQNIQVIQYVADEN